MQTFVHIFEKLFKVMFDHDVFRVEKLDVSQPPESRFGRAALSAYGKTGRGIWRLGEPLFKKVLERAGERHYALIVNEHDQFFMINSFISDGLWRLPGGGAAKSESATDAVTREVSEELKTEIDVSNSPILYSGTHDVYGFNTQIVGVNVHGEDFKPKPLVPEIARTGWFTYEELLTIPVDATVMKAVEAHKQG